MLGPFLEPLRSVRFSDGIMDMDAGGLCCLLANASCRFMRAVVVASCSWFKSQNRCFLLESGISCFLVLTRQDFV